MTDNPDFWADCRAVRDARLEYTGPVSATLPDNWQPPQPHKGHHGFNAAAFARCEECATKALRWGLLQSEASHAGRNARRERDIRIRAGLPV